jgi:PAS domain S-box-containing protein
MNRTLDAGPLAGLGLVVTLLVGNAVLSYWNTRQLDEDARWVAHTHEVLDSLEELLGNVRDAETGQRGYLLTGDGDFLKPYTAAQQKYEDSIERVRRLTEDNRDQQARIPRLRGLVVAKMKELAHTVALAGDGKADAAREEVKTGDGNRLMLAIRSEVKDMEDEEHVLLARRQSATSRAYVFAVVTGVAASLLGLMAVGGFVLLLERHLRTRARAAEVIHREREILQATLASIGDGVIVADPDGKVTFLNAVARQLTGWTAEDARGRPLTEVFHIVNEDTRDEVVNPALRALQDGQIVGLANHTVLVSRDGSERPIDDSAAPIREASGSVGGAVLVFRDITERRRADRSLRASEGRLRFVLDSMPQKVFTARPGGEADYFNPQWGEFTGLAVERMRDSGWTQIIHPDDVQENVKAWKQAVAAGEPYRFEHRFRRVQGDYRWHVTRAVPMRDEAGRVVLWVGSSTDIHDVKQSAEALREADRRKDEFLAMLAHELRNPLAPVRNSLEVMKRAGGDPAVLRELRTTMERQVGHMVKLVDDLLEISRISRGRLELKTVPVELASVLYHAVEQARPHIDSAGHDLMVTPPAEPVYLLADAVRLAQVFSNLLNNACKFTRARGRIWLTAERQGEHVVVSVKDTGMGIPCDKLGSVFEMFMQLDRSLERTQGGLGIGLTLVKRLVEMHGGKVEARSDGPGKGSEFVVRLPVHVGPGPQRPPAPPTAQEPRQQAGHRFLVVDDNRDAADTLTMLLRLTGVEAHTAYDGQEAVEAAANLRPDVILFDIGMPRLNGYDAARHIREQPWGKDVLLVALTGLGQLEDRRRSLEAGFNEHLVKPVEHAALEKLIARLMTS